MVSTKDRKFHKVLKVQVTIIQDTMAERKTRMLRAIATMRSADIFPYVFPRMLSYLTDLRS